MKKNLAKQVSDPKENTQPDLEGLRADPIEEILDSVLSASVEEAGLQRKLKKEDKKRFLAILERNIAVKVTSSVQVRSGPLPPAEDLAKYEDVLPGSADRIMTMGEKEQDHRHALDITSVQAEIRYSNKGMYIGALLLIILIITAGYGAYIENSLLTASCLGVGVLSVIAGFLKAKIFK